MSVRPPLVAELFSHIQFRQTDCVDGAAIQTALWPILFMNASPVMPLCCWCLRLNKNLVQLEE